MGITVKKIIDEKYNCFTVHACVRELYPKLDTSYDENARFLLELWIGNSPRSSFYGYDICRFSEDRSEAILYFPEKDKENISNIVTRLVNANLVKIVDSKEDIIGGIFLVGNKIKLKEKFFSVEVFNN